MSYLTTITNDLLKAPFKCLFQELKMVILYQPSVELNPNKTSATPSVPGNLTGVRPPGCLCLTLSLRVFRAPATPVWPPVTPHATNM